MKCLATSTTHTVEALYPGLPAKQRALPGFGREFSLMSKTIFSRILQLILFDLHSLFFSFLSYLVMEVKELSVKNTLWIGNVSVIPMCILTKVMFISEVVPYYQCQLTSQFK